MQKMSIYINLSKEKKKQILLVPGEYKGIKITEESIKNTQWPEKTVIKFGHDKPDKEAPEIGEAIITVENSTVAFEYEIDDEMVQLTECKGWSADLEITVNEDNVAEIKSLNNIALLKDEPPAVQEAKIQLSGGVKTEGNKEKILKEFELMKETVESLRLQLTELKQEIEKAKKEPQKQPEPLHKQLQLALGEEPSLEDIVRVGLDLGIF